MRYPVITQDTPRRSDPLLVAMGIFAASVFIGSWVIGPALTHNAPKAPAAPEAPLTYKAMLARPDPSPYRAATPAFDMSAQPGYGAAAREHARAELGGHPIRAEDSFADFPARPADDADRPRAQYRYRTPDRHAVH